MKKLIFLMLFIASAVSCNILDSDNIELMNISEELLTEFPDSSFSILSSIELSKLRSKSAKARYALLYTKAQHKCYNTIPNDSLINIAVEYYKKKGSGRDYAEALMYRGAALYDMMDYKEALNSYKLAEEILEGGEEYDLLALINSRMGELHRKLYSDVTMSIERDKIAADYYSRVRNKKNEGRAYHFIAARYIFLSNRDSALFYLKKSLEIAAEISDIYAVNENYYLLMLLHNNYREYKDAIKIGISSISQSRVVPSNIVHKLCRAYAKMGKISTARMYFERYNLGYKMDLADYMTLAIIEEEGNNYNAALSHNKKVQEITDSMVRGRRVLNAAMAEKRFDYQKVVTVNKVLRERQWTLFFVALFIICVLIIIAMFTGIKSNKRKRLLAEKDSFAEHLKSDSKVETSAPLKKFSKTNPKEARLIDLMGKRIGALGRLMDISYRYGTNGDIFLREYNQIMNMTKLGKDVLADLCDVVNIKTNGLMDYLKEHHPSLTKDDLCIIALVYFKFPPTAICALCSYRTPDSVYVRKNRITNKMGIKEQLDKYLARIERELNEEEE